MKIKTVFSCEARHDLSEACDYIAFQLQNRSAARAFLAKIQKAVSVLSQFPESGTPLSFSGSEHLYRYLICGSYMVFYRFTDQTVFIDRILYGRRDYLSILFGDELADDSALL